jgi:hypothetical protein
MKSNITTSLDHPHLSNTATTAHVFPEIKKSLISIAKFCDDGCTCTFGDKKLEIRKNNKLIITGRRNNISGLWEIPLPLKLPEEINNVYEMKKVNELIKYHHKTCFSPVKSTWIRAIEDNFFMKWPGLTKQRVNSHLEKSEATVKGHLHQQRQNTRSTSKIINSQPPNEDEFKEKTLQKSNLAFTTTRNLTEEIHTDQTGKFPIRSSANNQYVCICYDYDSNSILAKAIPSRKQDSLATA